MNEEAIYILTKLKLENFEKYKDLKLSLTYEELLDYTIKTLKLIERIKEEKICVKQLSC